MSRLLPRSLRGQVLAVITLALVLAQALSLWLFADERELAVRAALAREALDRTENVVELLERTPPGSEAAILAAATSPLVRFTLDAHPLLAHEGQAGAHRHRERGRNRDQAGGPAGARLRAELAARFGPGRELRLDVHRIRGVMPPMPGMPPRMRAMHRRMAMSAVELQLAVRLADGRWLNVTTRFHRPPLQWAATDLATFVISVALLAGALWLLLGRITLPLARLSAAADRLGRGERVQEIAPSGPEELSRLTVAFNRMQARLHRFVDERAQLLAALGHDLRSPLTALRVRAEMVDDDETRAALIASIDEMHQMVEATLTYARGTIHDEPPRTVALAPFLAALVADYTQTGREVALAAPPPGAGLRLRPGATRRALRNLIDNALRYGQRARIRVEDRGEEIAIHIDDDGPGIPPAELAQVFEPFVRLETSRSRETGGTGLGLAIARSLIRAQGGEVTLANRPGGGLRATITLPRADAPAEADPC